MSEQGSAVQVIDGACAGMAKLDPARLWPDCARSRKIVGGFKGPPELLAVARWTYLSAFNLITQITNPRAAASLSKARVERLLSSGPTPRRTREPRSPTVGPSRPIHHPSGNYALLPSRSSRQGGQGLEAWRAPRVRSGAAAYSPESAIRSAFLGPCQNPLSMTPERASGSKLTMSVCVVSGRQFARDFEVEFQSSDPAFSPPRSPIPSRTTPPLRQHRFARRRNRPPARLPIGFFGENPICCAKKVADPEMESRTSRGKTKNLFIWRQRTGTETKKDLSFHTPSRPKGAEPRSGDQTFRVAGRADAFLSLL